MIKLDVRGFCACGTCPIFEPKVSRIYKNNEVMVTIVSCEHDPICFEAVTQYMKQEEGKDANASE